MANPPATRDVSRHVLYRLAAELYAFPVSVVREMVRVQPAAAVPGAPTCVRGVINLRGAILPLVDLRVALGMQSALTEINELCDLLTARQRDHEEWLNELERCARTGDPFTKALDPEKCAFGRWYSSFKTDHLVLRTALGRLDAPHRAIHGTAHAVLDLASRGQKNEALALIEERRRGELAELIAALSNLRGVIRDQQRELVIVVEAEHKTVGICVDSIEGVELLAEHGQPVGELIGDSNTAEIVLRGGNGTPVQLLSLERLFLKLDPSLQAA